MVNNARFDAERRHRVSEKRKKFMVAGVIAVLTFLLFNIKAGYLQSLLTPEEAFELLASQSFWLNELINVGLCGLIWLILYRSMVSEDR